jgi:hypothetical protein
MTTEEALLLIPTHIMINAGTPIIKGDETLEFQDADYGEWEADIYPLGHGVGGFTHARRPIPESVRQAMAELMISAPNSRYEPFEFWLLSTQGETK